MVVAELGLDPPGVHGERAGLAVQLRGEGGVGDDGAVERQGGGEPVDLEFGQGAGGALQRLLAGGAGDDELGQQRVQGGADHRARLRRRSRPGRPARRAGAAGDGAGRGQETAAGVLAVDPEFDGVAADGAGSSIAQRLAVGDAEHLAHQVDAGDLLGDRVLDLQPGVDLEEGNGAVLADEEFAGAGADVAGLFAGSPWTPRGARSSCCVGQERRRCLLDQFLVAALQRAVPGGDDDDVAVGVGQALGLHVPGPVEVALDEALAAAEGGDGLADGRVVQLRDLVDGAGDLEPAPAAAERGLDRDGQAVLLGEGDDLVGAGDRVGVPGTSGAPARWAMWRAATLSPRSRMACGGGPIQVSPASSTAWANSAFSDRNP